MRLQGGANGVSSDRIREHVLIYRLSLLLVRIEEIEASEYG